MFKGCHGTNLKKHFKLHENLYEEYIILKEEETLETVETSTKSIEIKNYMKFR